MQALTRESAERSDAIDLAYCRAAVYSALALVSTLALLSCFFVGLEAYMVWALQIVVYAGAIVVLFLFVIMLLNVQREERALPGPVRTWCSPSTLRPSRRASRRNAKRTSQPAPARTAWASPCSPWAISTR